MIAMQVSSNEKVFQGRDKAVMGMARDSHTTFNVEDMMLIQRPATEIGRIQLKPLKEGCPFLPKNEAGTSLIFKSNRH